MSNAWLRVLTALVGIPIVLGALYVGGFWFAGLIVVIAVLAQHESYALLEAGGHQPYRWAGLALGVVIGLRAVWPDALAVAWVGAIALLVWSTFTPSESPMGRLAATLFGIFYPTLLLTAFIDLRQGRGPDVGDTEAFYLCLTPFLMIWATDTLAYYTGKSIGQHKLAPAISPKKTWEGAVGGALGALAVGVALKQGWLAFLPWVHILGLALIGGVVSQVGDLAESRFKRAVGVKDSGTLLPGHGGLLDRFDAVILTAPLFFLYLAYVARVYG